jgi:hypothetical protein
MITFKLFDIVICIILRSLQARLTNGLIHSFAMQQQHNSFAIEYHIQISLP